MADQAETMNRSMLTREGWMRFMVTEKMGRLMVAGEVLTPQQIYFSVPILTLDVPKAEAMEPRNRHERRAMRRRNR